MRPNESNRSDRLTGDQQTLAMRINAAPASSTKSTDERQPSRERELDWMEFERWDGMS